MSYTVRFTDETKTLTVFDNTSNTDTSLVFPGRNVTGYGRIIAENFLHLLENFSGPDEPINPISGQLWFDSESETLKINVSGLPGNDNWKAASGIYKGPTAPNIESSKTGELWVDTSNQQLRLFNGSRWTLVGPTQTSIGGLKYGPTVENIDDTDNTVRSIVTFYIADVPVIIVSKDSFTPKLSIPGFNFIRSGVNVNAPALSDQDQVAAFEGGFLPKLTGVATIAESLRVSDTDAAIPASRFLRSDTTNTTEFGFNVRNNNGITIGLDQNFNISTNSGGPRIYNSVNRGSIDFQINRNGVPDTIIKISDNQVGINTQTPQGALDVNGNIISRGPVLISDESESTNFNTGSLRANGGAAFQGNVRVGKDLFISGEVLSKDIHPVANNTHDIGSSSARWRTVRAERIVADVIEGQLSGNIDGIAGSAFSLEFPVTVRMLGDVTSSPISIQSGNETVSFNTVLNTQFISNKPEPADFRSKANDFVLTFRPSEVGGGSSGLLKQTRDNFIGDLGLPIGAILPYAGLNAPFGFLLCDGSEIEISKYPSLYGVIADLYNGSGASPLLGVPGTTFRLPDLRGRFALGVDTMDNGSTVPQPTGGFVDGGGGDAGRVPDATAKNVAGAGGLSSTSLTNNNIPQHTHTLNVGGVQYSAIRDTTVVSSSGTAGRGPTAVGGAQYLNNTGTVNNDGNPVAQPFDIMNPYLTVNYIIRSGPPAFASV
jgi:microcystin-dependent protein